VPARHPEQARRERPGSSDTQEPLRVATRDAQAFRRSAFTTRQGEHGRPVLSRRRAAAPRAINAARQAQCGSRRRVRQRPRRQLSKDLDYPDWGRDRSSADDLDEAAVRSSSARPTSCRNCGRWRGTGPWSRGVAVAVLGGRLRDQLLHLGQPLGDEVVGPPCHVAGAVLAVQRLALHAPDPGRSDAPSIPTGTASTRAAVRNSIIGGRPLHARQSAKLSW
jgi:hypothetical protein